MSRAIILLAAVSAACLVTACGTTGQKVIENAQGNCARRYLGTVNGGLLGGSFAGSVDIDCNSHLRGGSSTPPKADVYPDIDAALQAAQAEPKP